MKRRVLIGAGVVATVGMSCAGLWWEYGAVWSERPDGGAVDTAPRAPASWMERWPETPEEVVESVDALLGDGSERAWRRLTHLYKGSDEPTKRQILEHATRTRELKGALSRVVACVGDDPTPIDEDPMIEEAAQLLKDRWSEPEDLDYGRRLMLMQETEKRQWVLAKAMITFAAGLPAESEFHAQKRRLSTKLIDLHASVSSEFVRASIAEGIQELGSRDVALVLSSGPNAPLGDLEVVGRERAAQAEARERLMRAR